jgi:3-oxoacyl-(acyl-carrier-protein) synthase
MGIYINSASAISPQHTFLEENYLQPIVAEGLGYKKCIEPEYKNYIDPKLLRRMARIIKMGLASAKQCLQSAGIEQPGAIIVGTGLGCLEDTEKFLSGMVASDGPPSPTPFIQSTHNTIAGQLSLLLNCHAYSTTYAQRGHSFENALHDGIMQLQLGIEHVLVGGVDEMTETSLRILMEMDCWGKSANDPAWELGEGACFFLLSSNRKSNTLAEIAGVETIYHPPAPADVEEKINDVLHQNGLEPHDIDGVLLGENGIADPFYDHLKEKIFKDTAMYRFKNLSGDYFTSLAFGMNLAAHMIKNQREYEGSIFTQSSGRDMKHLLIYSHFNEKYHTIVLLKKCPDS